MAARSKAVEHYRAGLQGAASSNITRRNMSKGQKAMALAMVYPDPAQAGRKKNGSKIEPFHDVHKGALSHARTVLAAAPDLAALVKNGSKANRSDSAPGWRPGSAQPRDVALFDDRPVRLARASPGEIVNRGLPIA